MATRKLDGIVYSFKKLEVVKLMLITMDPDIAHFTLKEANAARKTVAKKKMSEIPALKEKFINQCPNENFGEYVWNTVMAPQMGYSFSLPHSLAYSFVGFQTLILATSYPSIYWNCACLITNSGGELDSVDDDDFDDDEDDDAKKKNRSTKYGKIAAAIGKIKKEGVAVSLPNINKSSLSFIPDLSTNSILYGLKGVTGVGEELVAAILKNRPFTDIEDFLERVKKDFSALNKTHMINLIKSGAFDLFYKDRMEAIDDYLLTSLKVRKKVDMGSIGLLIQNNLVPDEYSLEIKLSEFNRYIKGFAFGAHYLLDERAANFYFERYGTDNVEMPPVDRIGIEYAIRQKVWDKLFMKETERLRQFLKDRGKEMIVRLNAVAIEAEKEKYFSGSKSKWEMESVSFYSEEHELAPVLHKFDIFSSLPETPVVERMKREKNGRTTPIYQLNILAGTVLDKHKDKHSVTILCGDDVVTVKIWRNQYAIYDKQISKRVDGKKKIIERSWFKKGTKLIVVGIRRGDTFVPKTYYSSKWKKPIYKILDVQDQEIIVQAEREIVE